MECDGGGVSFNTGTVHDLNYTIQESLTMDLLVITQLIFHMGSSFNSQPGQTLAQRKAVIRPTEPAPTRESA